MDKSVGTVLFKQVHEKLEEHSRVSDRTEEKKMSAGWEEIVEKNKKRKGLTDSLFLQVHVSNGEKKELINIIDWYETIMVTYF